jgi:hypothetical protein
MIDLISQILAEPPHKNPDYLPINLQKSCSNKSAGSFFEHDFSQLFIFQWRSRGLRRLKDFIDKHDSVLKHKQKSAGLRSQRSSLLCLNHDSSD